MLSDAHSHLNDLPFFQIQQEQFDLVVINCDSPAEFRKNKKLIYDHSSFVLSAGIHPWKADQITTQEIEPILRQVSIIGEIGLDNVWCDVPLEKQTDVFLWQLDYAATHKKPVILHTKGMESEIAALIARYPNHYFVHWYSSLEHIEEFLKLDCYFSVGPSFKNDPAVQQVVEKVPINRLLIESDGLDALKWALDSDLPVEEYPTCIKAGLSYIASIKKLTLRQVETHLFDNLKTFISYGYK